ncbi:hypothetical protein AM587_10005623 [Phytophthora nicotianae]|nr:hypothetical protein AM587_10005623 [Phytophthora nicotianae]
MYNVYAGLFAGNHDFHHEYIFMLKWLIATMEMSGPPLWSPEILQSLPPIYAIEDQRALQALQGYEGDESVAGETIYLHKKDGFHKKCGYSIFVYLSMAMTVINVLANQTDKPQWQQCQCAKCIYRWSPEWRRNRPDGIPLATLPPMRFYRRGSKGVSPFEEIYRKQREKKQ